MNIIYMQLTRPFLATAHKGSCSGWIIWWGSTGHAVWQRAQETAVSQNESWQCKYRCFSRIFADIYIYTHIYIFPFISIYISSVFLLIFHQIIPSSHILSWRLPGLPNLTVMNPDGDLVSMWTKTTAPMKDVSPTGPTFHGPLGPWVSYSSIAIYLGVRW